MILSIKYINHILLYFAGLIIFMHSVIPHAHYDDVESVAYEKQLDKADEWSDYFELIFHTELGEGHLENFISGQGLDLDLSFTSTFSPLFGLAIQFSYLPIREFNDVIRHYKLEDDTLPDCYIRSTYLLRGPPIIS